MSTHLVTCPWCRARQRARLEKALTALEGDDRESCWRYLPDEHRSSAQALAGTLEQAWRALVAYLDSGDAERDGDDAAIYAMGGVVYGRHGARRYSLRGDGTLCLIRRSATSDSDESAALSHGIKSQ